MRYLLDEDLSQISAEIARSSGVNVLSVHELGWNGIADEALLAAATEQGRIVVTQNYGDFHRLAMSWAAQEQMFSGILVVPESIPNGDVAGIARALIRFETERTGSLPPYYFDFLRRDSSNAAI